MQCSIEPLARFFTPALASALALALKPVLSTVLRARLRAVTSIDATPALAAVTVPILCLHASHDRLVPTSSTAEIAAFHPHCQVVELDGPHFLLQANPEGAAKAFTAFVRSSTQVEAGRQFMQEFHDAFRQLAK